jgi:hypothetical protein
MKDHISSAEIATACLSFSSFFFDSCNDFYGRTWLCSHIRFVEIEPDRFVESSVLLALILSRSPPNAISMEAWLPESNIQPITNDSLREKINHGLSDLKDSEDPNELLRSSLHAVDTSSATDIHYFQSNAYRYGPTHQVFWRNQGRFFFLEIHNES